MATMNLQQCKVCTKRKFNSSIGLICGLTNEKPNFIGRCEEGELDENEAKRLQKLQEEAEEEEMSGGFLGPEKHGMKKVF
nr:hypothetical protein [uncultured Carboxylicivirga sp.]